MMSVREALTLGGLASLAAAALLFVLAVYTYFAEDIRGVRDDLAGRRRKEGRVAVLSRVGQLPAQGDQEETLIGLEPGEDACETAAYADGTAGFFVVTKEFLLCAGLGQGSR